MYCPYCGAQNNDESRFCAKCGKPLESIPDAGAGSQENSGKAGKGSSVVRDAGTVRDNQAKGNSGAETAPSVSGKKKLPVIFIAAACAAAAILIAVIAGRSAVKTFDPFADVKVSFDGVSPIGRASYTTDSSLSFKFSNRTHLANGDKVTLYLDTGTKDGKADRKYFLKNFGAIPSTVSREYEVSGLPSYITKASDIPDSLLKEMQSQAKDVMDDFIGENWNAEFDLEGGTAQSNLVQTLEDFQYIGCYTLASRKPQSGGINNYIYLVYKVTGNLSQAPSFASFLFYDNTEPYNGQMKYYTTFRFKNASAAGDGTGTVDLTDCQMATDTISNYDPTPYITVLGYNYPGYMDLAKFERKNIVPLSDNYTSDNNIDKSLLFEASEAGLHDIDPDSAGNDTPQISDSESQANPEKNVDGQETVETSPTKQDKDPDLTARYKEQDESFDSKKARQDEKILGNLSKNGKMPEYLSWVDAIQKEFPSEFVYGILYNGNQDQKISDCALNILQASGDTKLSTTDSEEFLRECRVNNASAIESDNLIPDDCQNLTIEASTTDDSRAGAIFCHSVQDLTDTKSLKLVFSGDETCGVCGVTPGMDFYDAIDTFESLVKFGGNCNMGGDYKYEQTVKYDDGDGTSACITAKSNKDEETVQSVEIELNYEMPLNGKKGSEAETTLVFPFNQDKNPELTARYKSADRLFDNKKIKQNEKKLGDLSKNGKVPEYLFWTDTLRTVFPDDLINSIIYNGKAGRNAIDCALNVLQSSGNTRLVTYVDQHDSEFSRGCRLNDASVIESDNLIPKDCGYSLKSEAYGNSIKAEFFHTDNFYKWLSLSFDEGAGNAYGVWGITPGSDYNEAINTLKERTAQLGDDWRMDFFDEKEARATYNIKETGAGGTISVYRDEDGKKVKGVQITLDYSVVQ